MDAFGLALVETLEGFAAPANGGRRRPGCGF
jgi:hypothetical protein